jgi:hypothetical protein
VATSEATIRPSSLGDRAGIDAAMRSFIHRNNASSAASISARKANSPAAIRQ